MRKIQLLYFILFLLSGKVLAENGCPDGYQPWRIPIEGPNDCAAIPRKSPEPAAVNWQTRWGAIAFDGSKGVLGAVTSIKSKKSAKKAAIAQCRVNGGGDNCKKFTFTYYNQCAAVAWGDTTYRGGGRPTLEEAKKDALKECSQAAPNCKIVYADCSLAVQIQ